MKKFFVLSFLLFAVNVHAQALSGTIPPSGYTFPAAKNSMIGRAMSAGPAGGAIQQSILGFTLAVLTGDFVYQSSALTTGDGEYKAPPAAYEGSLLFNYYPNHPANQREDVPRQNSRQHYVERVNVNDYRVQGSDVDFRSLPGVSRQRY